MLSDQDNITLVKLQKVIDPAIISFLFSLIIGGMFWFFRLPLNASSVEILSYVCLTASAVFLPIMAVYHLKVFLNNALAFLVIVSVSMIVIPSLIGAETGFYGRNLIIIVGASSIVWGCTSFCIIHLSRFRSIFGIIRNSSIMLGFCLLLSAAIAMQNEKFLFFDALSLLGISDPDHYYFFALTNILRNFSEISTGVDGVNNVKVHFLSQLFLARTAGFFGGATELSVVYFGCVVCIPVLTNLYILLIRDVFVVKRSVLLIFISIWLIQWGFQLIEPRYLLWRTLPRFFAVFFSMAFLLFIIRNVMKGEIYKSSPIELIAYNFGNIMIIIMHPGIGFVFTCISTYYLLRSNLRKPFFCALVTFGTLAVAAITVFQVMDVSWLVLNKSPNWHPDTSGYLTFYYSGRHFQVITYFVMPIYYIGSRIAELYPLSRRSIIDGFNENRFVDIEIVSLMLAICLFFDLTTNAVAPVSILTAQVFWLIPFFVGRMLRAEPEEEYRETAKFLKRDTALVSLLMILSALWIQRFTIEFQDNRDRLTKSLLSISKHLYFNDAQVGGYWRLGQYSLADYGKFEFKPSAQRSKLIKHLKVAKKQAGTNLAFYFPADNTIFWNLEGYCATQALFIPATTGVPVLDGMPPLWRNCGQDRAILHEYGFPDIHPRRSDRVLTDSELCLIAKSGGIHQVYRVDSLEGEWLGRIIRCSK